MMRRYVMGAVMVASLTISLTGCLGETGDKSADKGNGNGSGNGGPGNVIKLSAAQVLDKAAEKTGTTDTVTASLSMNISGLGEGDVTATGTMKYRMRPDVAFSMTFDQMNFGRESLGGMEQRLVGDTIYMKLPNIPGAGSPTGKPWLKISLREIEKKAGINLQQLMQQSQQLDPVQNIKLLTAAKDSRQVGRETIEGIQTTHYTGTYSMSEAAEKLSPEQRETFKKLGTDGGMSKMAFDVWVDDQQLPKRLTMRSVESAKQTMTFTMTYRNYGQPVTILAPPADQVEDASKVFGQLGGGTGGT